MAGDTQTGVQIMQMAKGLDTGDILLSETLDILPADTAASLSERMSRIGAGLWPRGLAALARGGLTPTPQTGEPSYAHKIEKTEARIDWSKTAEGLDCHIRGLAPFPGAWCEWDGARLKLHLAKVEDGGGKPGEILDETGLIACGKDALRLIDVQPAGKGKMSMEDFLRGKNLPKGTILS